MTTRSAYALRVEADGAVAGLLRRHRPVRALVELADGADLFLCEASFVECGDNPPDLHLTGREAGDHAARAGVERLVLTHIPPWTRPRARSRSDDASRRLRRPVELVAAGCDLRRLTGAA